ncbi:hypothetical protein MHI39_01340 [Heyndrickxia sp. FSL K6-6286]|uniref:hypothetical protein n=1 Tax=Heyndrickxia sp. FSL K6-6286 TaxID=2921510 RepID=UPI0003A95398
MTNQTFSQQINEYLWIQHKYEINSYNFLLKEDNEDLYLYGVTTLNDALSSLPNLLDDFKYITNPNDETWHKIWEKVNVGLGIIVKSLELFSEKNPEDIRILEYLWYLFDNAYYKIEEILECNFDFDYNFKEIMNWIQELQKDIICF